MPHQEERVCVGIVATAFGIKGFVKIRTYTQSPSSFLSLKKALTFECSKPIILTGEKIVSNSMITARINGIDNRTDAELLRQEKIFILKKHLPKLDDDEFYHNDLVGLTVVDLDGNNVGVVKAVHDYGAGTFLDVETTDHKLQTIAFNKASVLAVDINKHQIIIDKTQLL